MKNLKSMRLCITVMVLFLSGSFFSCKKEDVSNDSVQKASSFEDFPNDDPAFNDFESPVDSNEIIEGGVATQGIFHTEATYTRKNLLFDYTSENSLIPKCSSINYWCTLSKYASYSIQRSSSYRRAGSYATKYELNKSDGDVAGSKRTETNRSSKSETTVKCERWYGASYFLPSSFVSDVAPELLTQWHTVAGGSPPLGLWTQNGQWSIAYFGDKRKVIGNYATNKWTDFVFHVKWSPYSDGLIEVWKDGVKVFSYTGKNIYSGIAYGAYMKTGIYKWPWKTGSYGSTTTKRIVYIDEVRIGNYAATYNDVKPGY